MAHASFAKSYYCTVLPTIAFYFLPYTMRSTHGHSIQYNDVDDEGERAINEANAKRATPLTTLDM